MLAVNANDYFINLCRKSADKLLAFTAKNRLNIFRLTAVLCLFLLINPAQYIKQKENTALTVFNYEDGIGGGFISEEMLTEEEAEIFMSTASLETDAMMLDSLSKPLFLFYDSYLVKSGDNISTLAVNYGLNQDTIISINKVTNSRLLQIGTVLKIPNQDGILHTVLGKETLDLIAEKYSVDKEAIITANELFSEKIVPGSDLFIPGAKLDWVRLQEINGDLFIWPIRGAITSSFGWRRDPFNASIVQYHNGIDIRGNTGTAVAAAMAGRVSAVGWDDVYGFYVIINHHSGYRTLYAHLSVIQTRAVANVAQGERIGDVGSTGKSTGAHLHFTIYKDGVTINPSLMMR